MNDREKVISAITNCIGQPKCRDCPWEECEQFDCKKTNVPVNLLLDALELLKEQEPKLVKIDGGSVLCPSCGNELFTYPRQKFCDECGQAVNWNDKT